VLCLAVSAPGAVPIKVVVGGGTAVIACFNSEMRPWVSIDRFVLFRVRVSIDRSSVAVVLHVALMGFGRFLGGLYAALCRVRACSCFRFWLVICFQLVRVCLLFFFVCWLVICFLCTTAQRAAGFGIGVRFYIWHSIWLSIWRLMVQCGQCGVLGGYCYLLQRLTLDPTLELLYTLSSNPNLTTRNPNLKPCT